MIEVAIIGAGPYGLSIAAHLGHLGIDYRIYGKPMQLWDEHMPKGMSLKSEGFATNLSHPNGDFTLSTFCSTNNIPYEDIGLPIKLDVFVQYGMAFQRRFAAYHDPHMVVSVRPLGSGFELRLDNDDTLVAKRGVMAIGIKAFAYIPSELTPLTDKLSHSVQHADLSTFAGQEVLVVGRGASAIDSAVLLHQGGARASVIGRGAWLDYIPTPRRSRSWRRKLVEPLGGLGPGWKNWAVANLPLAFHALPEARRLSIARTHLGPAPGWFARDYVDRHIPLHLGASIASSSITDGRAQIIIRQHNATRTMAADHVLAATGYRVDVQRIECLAPVLSQLRCVSQTPVLSSYFESSVPGLYFVGVAATNAFGPVMRFVYGADFVGGRLARHLQVMRRAVSRRIPRTGDATQIETTPIARSRGSLSQGNHPLA
jgi:thioredoxin reductase